MKVSICTTNYNCAHALERHLTSVYGLLSGLDFEYIVVDNRSNDRSSDIFRHWASRHTNMTVLSERCTMGEGRQIAFRHSKGNHVMVIDTDVVYVPLLRHFVDAYLAQCPHLSVQAVFCGIFPRQQWFRIGGRRSLNTNEDVDMWIRMWRLGTMRWYPVYLGENLKEASAVGSADYLSSRYPRRERITRLLRREWDLLKTREVGRLDLHELIEANTIDLELGPRPGPWPQDRTRQTRMQHWASLVREFRLSVLAP